MIPPNSQVIMEVSNPFHEDEGYACKTCLVTPSREEVVINQKFSVAYMYGEGVNRVVVANTTNASLTIAGGTPLAEFHPRSTESIKALEQRSTSGASFESQQATSTSLSKAPLTEFQSMSTEFQQPPQRNPDGERKDETVEASDQIHLARGVSNEARSQRILANANVSTAPTGNPDGKRKEMTVLVASDQIHVARGVSNEARSQRILANAHVSTAPTGNPDGERKEMTVLVASDRVHVARGVSNEARSQRILANAHVSIAPTGNPDGERKDHDCACGIPAIRSSACGPRREQ